MWALLQRVEPYLERLDYAALHRFSIDRPEVFWAELWDFLAIVGERGEAIVEDHADVAGARWFPEARLNFAESFLKRSDDGLALIAITEDGGRRILSWCELRDQVLRVRGAFRALGVCPGDRVASCLPNEIEAVVAMLATVSLGAIWTACGTDLAAEAVIDRYEQVAPRLLLTPSRYSHAGKTIDYREKAGAIASALPSLLAHVVIGEGAPSNGLEWRSLLETAPDDSVFDRFPFDQPAFIVYSSGTTGHPKAIVHGSGGTLLQTMKEMALHVDCRRDELVFWPCSPGWMVWNVMVSALALGAPVFLYEGSPTWPRTDRLFTLMEQEGAGIVRIVPPLLDLYRAEGVKPAETHRLDRLRCLVSGSAPLMPHHVEWIYDTIAADLHVMSPAGGTDVMGTLASGDPTGPVWPGEIQVRSLGMAVEVWDEDGHPLVDVRGELVCTHSFPSRPLAIWGDDGRRLHETYYDHFPGVWRHGDGAVLTSRGGIKMCGRSDNTIKHRGTRMCSGDFRAALAGLRSVRDALPALCEVDGQTHLALFVLLGPGETLDDTTRAAIALAVREKASPRHAPDAIVAAPDLLRSINGKPSEIALREALAGRSGDWIRGLSNPELVPWFSSVPERLAPLPRAKAACIHKDIR